MLKKLKIPIRFKILITVLLVITVAVGTITFTMANLFHADKSVYIHDLTSVIALHTAQEARSLLVGYSEKLKVFGRIMSDAEMTQDQKTAMITRLFEDFREFVTVTLYVNGAEQVTMYDSRAIEKSGAALSDIAAYRTRNPLPLEVIQAGAVYIENSTLTEKLPCLTIAVAYQPSTKDRTSAVVSATIRLDSLERLASRSKVFETFLIDPSGKLLAHSDIRKVIEHVQASWIPQLKSLQTMNTLGTTLEYERSGVPLVGGFASVEFSGLLAGVEIPKSAAYLTARDLLNNLVLVALVLLVISAIVGLLGSRVITRPIERLSAAAKGLGKGQFDIRVEPTSRDEIGDLSQSFNQMAQELDLREQEIKKSQAALVQSEKLAAFGQLGAGIAHEVKNPLAGIIGFAQLSLRKIGKDSPIYENLSVIEKEAKRSKVIIENLLKFARQEKVAFQPIAVNVVVEEAATIVDHQLGIKQIRLEKELTPDLPQIIGNANQIVQVLLNFMINAQQAMDGKPGTVTLSTRLQEGARIEIRVKDTGPGIPADIQARIFEPFFTTKPAGKGTGLGLSVSYGIIKDHRGEIRVESAPGEGATFIISLPTADAADAPMVTGDPAQAGGMK